MSRVQAVATALGLSVAATGGPAGVEGIPSRALVAYVAAANSAPCDIPWWDLAAVGAVESGHGTHGGAHIQEDGTMTEMAVSYASARGPMQFIDPTWDHYGAGGNVNDIDDAAPATARLLCADGYERDRMDSFQAYNGGGYRGSDTAQYAAEVDRFAGAYKAHDASGLGGRGSRLRRFFDGLERRWVNLGDGVERVGLSRYWRAADTGLFGVSTVATESRSDGLDARFGSRLDQLIAGAPGEITIYSGKRDPSEQLVLWDRYQDGGTLAAWSDGKSCASDHCAGLAADLTFADDATERWAHAHAGDYGLIFDLLAKDEPWHVSLRDELR